DAIVTLLIGGGRIGVKRACIHCGNLRANNSFPGRICDRTDQRCGGSDLGGNPCREKEKSGGKYDPRSVHRDPQRNRLLIRNNTCAPGENAHCQNQSVGKLYHPRMDFLRGSRVVAATPAGENTSGHTKAPWDILEFVVRNVFRSDIERSIWPIKEKPSCV